MKTHRSNTEHLGVTEEDLVSHRRFCRTQRVAWAVMVLVLAVAFTGLLGSGPLSPTQAGGDGSRLRVEYERFVRYGAPSDLNIRVSPELARDGVIRLSVTRAYHSRVETREIVPQPERVEAGAEGCAYIFRVVPGQMAEIRFRFEPDRFGRLSYELRVGEHKLRIRQFAFP